MKHDLHPVLALMAMAALATPVAAVEAPFDFDTAPGRLPKTVVPLKYAVAIVPDMAALHIAGTESIELQFRGTTATVQFNSLNETLRDVRFDGKPVARVVSDDAQQLTTVTLKRPVGVGMHRLSFSYTGTIETEPRGLFAQKYTGSGGKQDTLLTTQMEATDARRMFPCWDEPAFRAVFELTMTVPAPWATVSNMPVARREVHGDLATVTFQPSPKMPSYLVEFSGGHLGEIAGRSGGTDFGVWVQAGREQDGTAALANAQQILADYNDYFGYLYPLPKLDSIAVPGGFPGAMENWGAITYNDTLLLVSASSGARDRQTVYAVQAHEMAHQWFGDLVTMAWWDDIWLNESFASWRAAKQTDARHPAWKWWELEDATKEKAMRADARPSSHAIEQHVTNELQAQNSFDPDITYDKGQSMLRMLESYLGADVFRSGIRAYMKARAYSNATSADLWNALAAASGKNVSRIAQDWTEKPGFPLVSVTATCDASGARTLQVSQSRFLLTGPEAAPSQWRIPLSIRSGVAGEPRTMLIEGDQTVAAGRCDETLSVNANAIGYYRARYDATTLALDTRQFARTPDGDRIALLDDQWALTQAIAAGSGAAALGDYLALAASMGTDLDTRAWQQIAGALGTIEYAERGSGGHDAFAASARALIKPPADALGWSPRTGENPDVSELRQTLLEDLGTWGDEATIREARSRFQAFVRDRAALSPDEQSAVLGIVGQYADAATFEQLLAIAKQATDATEQQRDYLALAEVRDPQLAARVAQVALSDELPPQAALLRFLMVIKLADHHPLLSWDTFTGNEKRLLAAIPSEESLIIAQSAPGVYWDALPLEQLESWVKAHTPAEMAAAVSRGMETARFKQAVKQGLIPAANAYIGAHPVPH